MMPNLPERLRVEGDYERGAVTPQDAAERPARCWALQPLSTRHA